MSFKSLVYVGFVFLFAACATEPQIVAKPEPKVVMPEPLKGLNVFVATDPLAIPAAGIAAQKMPNPRKPIPFDSQAESETQQAVLSFSMDLRENLEPIFRTRIEHTYSYVAGANYRWDELRRDQRNYSLVIWPTRTSKTSQTIDVYAVLVHEATGRHVWQHKFSDPYRTENAVLGGFMRTERVQIVQAMSQAILDEMDRQGVLAEGVTPVGGKG